MKGRRAGLIPLVVAGLVAAALVAVVAYDCFYSPLVPLTVTVFQSSIYLPLVSRQHRAPDRRIGVAEHTPLQAELLGLGSADYVSGQWRLPIMCQANGDCKGDTAVFLRPTERLHWSTWKLCSWSAWDGWYDEEGCRQWVRANPGMVYIVGNELFLGGDIGDGHWVDAEQYARWYHDARLLIKSEDSTAVVAPYGAIQDKGGLLIAVWDSYEEQFDALLPVDFYPVHFYCQVIDEPWWCWRKLTHWVAWLENHRGAWWVGPRDYRLTEWGLRAWSNPVPLEASLALMDFVIPELRKNDIGITQSAWWPSCNGGWPDQCTVLIRGSQVTVVGERYLKLALE